jgi:site-specific DNA recombinase
MFRLYLECGSVGALAEELARRNIVSKVRSFATGRTKGGGQYSVGALAHFLKNRFYIGEVVYRGETHAGEHASIIDHLRGTKRIVDRPEATASSSRAVPLSRSPSLPSAVPRFICVMAHRSGMRSRVHPSSAAR